MGHLPVRMGGSSFHSSLFSFFHHQPLITISRFVSDNNLCIYNLMDDLKCEVPGCERCMQTESCLLCVLKAPDIFLLAECDHQLCALILFIDFLKTPRLNSSTVKHVFIRHRRSFSRPWSKCTRSFLPEYH
jgi:hypothetical protein